MIAKAGECCWSVSDFFAAYLMARRIGTGVIITISWVRLGQDGKGRLTYLDDIIILISHFTNNPSPADPSELVIILPRPRSECLSASIILTGEGARF